MTSQSRRKFLEIAIATGGLGLAHSFRPSALTAMNVPAQGSEPPAATRKQVDQPGGWPWSSWRFYFLNDTSLLPMDRIL